MKFIYKQLAKVFAKTMEAPKAGNTRKWLPKGYGFGTPWWGFPRLSAVQNKWDVRKSPDFDASKKGRRLDSGVDKGYNLPNYYKTRYYRKTTTSYKQKGNPVKWHRYSVEEIDQLLPQFEEELEKVTQMKDDNASEEELTEHLPVFDEETLIMQNKLAPGLTPMFVGDIKTRLDFFIDHLHDSIKGLQESKDDQLKWITIPNCPDHVPIDEWARRQPAILADWQEKQIPPQAGDIYRRDNHGHTYFSYEEGRPAYWDKDTEKFMKQSHFGIRRKIWDAYEEFYANKPDMGGMSAEEQESAKSDLETIRQQRADAKKTADEQLSRAAEGGA